MTCVQIFWKHQYKGVTGIKDITYLPWLHELYQIEEIELFFPFAMVVIFIPLNSNLVFYGMQWHFKTWSVKVMNWINTKGKK